MTALPADSRGRRTGAAGSIPAVLKRLLIYLVLPNLCFALLGRKVYMIRSLVNIDYLFLGAAAGMLTRTVVVVAYTALVVVDAFVALAPVFHFSVETAFGESAQLLKLPAGVLSLAIVMIAGVAVATFGIARRGQRAAPRFDATRATLLAIALAVVALDIVGGTNRFSHRSAIALRINLATSALNRFGMAGRYAFETLPDGKDTSVLPPATGLTAGLRAAPDAALPPRILLVVGESLGLLAGTGNDELLAPLLTPLVRQRYDVHIDTVASRGATTEGELRELCGVDGGYLDIKRVVLAQCLPARLERHGFATRSFHGFSRAFFQRDVWYPRVGIAQSYFAEDASSPTRERMCGTLFSGICDDAMAALVHAAVLIPDTARQLLYWLTLSAHLPIDAASAAGGSLSCARIPAARERPGVCRLLEVQRRLIDSLAAIAMDPQLPPTTILLVGDHAPPFWSIEDRETFWPDRVMAVRLVPRLH